MCHTVQMWVGIAGAVVCVLAWGASTIDRRRQIKRMHRERRAPAAR